MIVNVTLSIKIDRAAWEEIYGGAVDVRSDVKRYAVQQLTESAAAGDGAILSVEAR